MERGPYDVGLDIGTNSLGWAVVGEMENQRNSRGSIFGEPYSYSKRVRPQNLEGFSVLQGGVFPEKNKEFNGFRNCLDHWYYLKIQISLKG